MLSKNNYSLIFVIKILTNYQNLSYINISRISISGNVVNTDIVLNSCIVNSDNRKIGQKGKETTEEKRKIIINLHNKCKTLSEISKIGNRPRFMIQGIIDRYGD